jgi:nucleoside-diphosphate-sugar epimerase
MKAFLTGGTGFLGGRLAARLAADGAEVVALVRAPAKAGELAALGATLASGDITDAAALEAPMRGCDVVYHLAAWYEIGAADGDALRRVNVEGTENVMAAASRAGVPRVVYCGTTAALGAHHEPPRDESAIHGRRRDHHSHYARTKWEAHQAVERWAARGLPVRLVLPGTVYGPGDTSLVGLVLESYLRGELFLGAFPGLELTLVHVDDVARAFQLAADRGDNGESYIAAGQIITVRDWFALLERLTGIPSPRNAVPPWMMRAAAPLYPLVAKILRLPPRLAEEGIEMATHGGWAYKSSKAIEKLGWSYRPLDQGMAETVDWFQRHRASAPRWRFA